MVYKQSLNKVHKRYTKQQDISDLELLLSPK